MPKPPLLSQISFNSELLQHLLDDVGACIYIKDHEARYRFVNASLLEQFGLTREQVLGFTDQELVGEDQIPERLEAQRQVLEHGIDIDHEVEQLLRMSAERGRFRCIEKPIRAANGQIQGLYGVVSDLSAFKRLQCRHREEHALLEALLEHTDNNVFLTDADNRVHYANRKVRERVGLTEQELIGKRLDELVSGEFVTRFQQQSEQTIAEQGPTRGVNAFTDNKGQTQYYWYVKQPLQWHDQTMIMGMSADITELYLLKEELHRQAYTDALTQLYNRRHFFEQAEREQARASRHARPLCLILMDIDHFKQINDRYGHPVGDQVLVEVAQCLKEQVRQEDLLARVGGEEFALLLADTDPIAARFMAERIRSRIAALQVSAGEALIHPPLSLGIALLQPEDETLDRLYKRSDEAL